ncbi:hypothetical protein KXD93_26790 [Mucilaginibacter sp. BJC16-A38]|uniref:hypothetical protein n=1 Tax=Mucilaginibacter phenanthrenivorans TaxID=1234842 RepID=UPI002157D9C6|nr:hypothetical protein [Mucilaginibacter phenanthrenivorans]MCR8561289.1 hypothetical protein [Mucilaginibacter phenanthrenivorans]
MTFDEFFKKKRVDLVALEKAEPALFAEFKNHYEQMGEKSFDHTKKYWFNKTRRQFPLAPEVKTEKPHIANPLAEQTITESLTEQPQATPSPKVGFTPKFRAAGIAKPAIGDKKDELPTATEPAPAPPAENAVAKPAGFVPRFKMKPKTEGDENSNPQADIPETPAAETVAAKPAGFVPRFKMKPKAEVEENPPATAAAAPAAPEVTEPKSAYKPRFIPPKPKVETTDDTPTVNETPPSQEITEKKPAYKPRFVPPKPKE